MAATVGAGEVPDEFAVPDLLDVLDLLVAPCDPPLGGELFAFDLPDPWRGEPVDAVCSPAPAMW